MIKIKMNWKLYGWSKKNEKFLKINIMQLEKSKSN